MRSVRHLSATATVSLMSLTAAMAQATPRQELADATVASQQVGTSDQAAPQNGAPTPGSGRDDGTAPTGEDASTSGVGTTGGGGDVVVTGSRIPQRNLQSAQPTLVIDSDTMQQRGFNNVADALNQLPSFGVPGSSAAGGQAGSFGSGQSFVNFFGLGDQRTLTIVNGRRFVSSNTASIFGPSGSGSQVDLNVIPQILVDRIETIAVGGAPIYGADAIAGTINIFTKRKFSGLQLDATNEISERGDGLDARIGAIAGVNFSEGRGNITIAGEFNQSNGLTYDSRRNARLNSFFTTPLDPDSPFQNTYIGDRRIPSLSQFGVPLVNDSIGIPLSPAQAADFGGQPSVTSAAGQPLGFDKNGNLAPIDFGQQTGNLINFNGGSGFSLPGNLRAQVRRVTATALAEYQLTDKVRVFGEAWYANSRGRNLRDQPVYNTGLFGAAGSPDGNLILSVDNPYLNAAARQTIIDALASNPATDAAPGTFYLGRANTDLATGEATSTVELYRFVGGLDGTFNALGRELRWELVGNYGRSETRGNERVLVQQNFENAINAVRDSSGNIVCAPGYTNAAIATISSTCAPINPFGQQNSQAAIDYVTAIANPRAVNEQWVVTASVSGNLFSIWGGDVGFAVGYEHREERARFDPGAFYYGLPDPNDPTTRTQFGRSVPIDPVAGKFSTNEGFGELTVPLIGPDLSVPLIRSLNLHGAVRYIDNSLAGDDWTYTGDVRWELFPGVTLRTNYTRSVRAPAITELFNPSSQIFTTANDPCDSRFLQGGPDPATRQANCAAAGLPADFQSNIVDFTARGSLEGNRELQNEVADANVFGAVLQPRFFPGLSVTADWVNIRVKGAIETLDADQVLEGCYDSSGYPNALCSNITRDADGQVTFIQTGYANAATRQFRGVVLQAGYQHDANFLGEGSQIYVNGSYQYLDRLTLRIGNGAVTTLRNSIGYSPNKATVDAGMRNDHFNLSVRWRYLGPTLNDPDAAPNTYEYPRVPGISFFDLTLGGQVNDRFNLRFIVDNLFDKGIPFPAPANGGVVTYFDAIYGRSFKASVSTKF